MGPIARNPMPDKTKILILGGGFGGIYAALHLDKTLAKDPHCEVTLVNETNFTLFTPMLHEVAASDVDPSDIVNPIRKLLRRTTFYEAVTRGIDLHAKKVTIAFGLGRTRDLSYDHLLIALGSETRFFDEPTRLNALQMKTLTDAIFLRNQMIGVYEAASVEPDEAAPPAAHVRRGRRRVRRRRDDRGDERPAPRRAAATTRSSTSRCSG